MSKITQKDVADVLGISVRTLQRELDTGGIKPAYWAKTARGHVARFTQAWLEELKCRVNGVKSHGSKPTSRARIIFTGTTQRPDGLSANQWKRKTLAKRKLASPSDSQTRRSASLPDWLA